VSKKFNSKQEVQEERKSVDSKFSDGLPDYLQDYFDTEELKQIKKEVDGENYSKPFRERLDFGLERDHEFWENNDVELRKVLRKTDSPVFDEQPRATERVSQEQELTPGEIKALVSVCEYDLELFAIRYFPHYLKKRSSTLHRYLYNTLSRELGGKKKKYRGLKLAIAAPRGNAKSSIVSSILPVWCICYKKKNFIIMLSDTKGQAEDFLSDVKRELELNDKLKRDFPEITGNVKDSEIRKGLVWRTDEIITKNMVKVIALGTGSKIRGRKFGVYRPDLVIGDDLENMEMVFSETQREKIRFNWFDKDVNFVGAAEADDNNLNEMTDFFLVGTILGKESLLNTIINTSEYPDWQTQKFKAVEKFSDSSLWDDWEKLYKDRFDVERIETAKAFFKDNEEEMLKGTKVLWPEGDPYYSLMIAKLKSYSAFISEKQNDPIDPSRVIVQKEELHWENFSTNTKVREAIDRGLKKGFVFGSLDPSLGKKHKKGDPSCITTLVRDPKTGFIFVVYFNLKVRSVDKQIDAILKSHSNFNYKLFGVETNAFQYVVAEALRKKSKELGIYVPVEEIDNYQDKKMRIESLVPFLKDGTIVFDSLLFSTNQMYNKSVEQIYTYTGDDTKNDDAPDSLEMAFRIAKKPRFRMITT